MSQCHPEAVAEGSRICKGVQSLDSSPAARNDIRVIFVLRHSLHLEKGAEKNNLSGFNGLNDWNVWNHLEHWNGPKSGSHHLHVHVDQGRSFFFFDDLDRPFHRRANLLRFGDRPLAVHTKGAGQVGKINRGLRHFHTHEFVLHRSAAVDRDLFLMLHVVIINPIIGHHRQQWHAGVGGSPQGARRVQHLAVALQIDADLARAPIG